MQKIKHLKNDYLQLGNLIYKPYSVCDLPPSFGATDENGYSFITEWFNSASSQDLLANAIENCKEIDSKLNVREI